MACLEPVVRGSDSEDIICIVPSGELFAAPLHAVRVEGAPLLARNPVFYAPSATALRYCMKRGHSAGASDRGAAVFGNPWWDLDEAEKEVIEVARSLGVRPIAGVGVTRDRWLQAMRSSDILHFAGHAAFAARDPLASALYLTGKQVVTARDFFEPVRQRMRLVTLSGCQTGVNSIHPGDQLLGLPRAFLYAGAAFPLLTLWSIDDASAAHRGLELGRGWREARSPPVQWPPPEHLSGAETRAAAPWASPLRSSPELRNPSIARPIRKMTRFFHRRG